MNFKPVQIIILGAATMLYTATMSAQGDAAYTQVSMAQANQAQPNPSSQTQPGPGQQQTPMPSMQDSTDSSGQTVQVMKDKMFLRATAEGGIAEVQFGQLAAQNASSEDVKTLGQKMVDEHTALNKDMEPVADSIGVKLPTHMNKVDQAEYDKLKGLTGEAFDTEYLTLMVRAHHKDMREFRLEAANTQNDTLKDAVVKGEKVIHEHLVMVDNLAKSKGIELPHHGNRPAPPPAQ